MGAAVARVRLFAALREIAGASWLDVSGETVDDVLGALSEKFGGRFDEIARSGSVVVGGERVSGERAVREDDEVALLPPVSGGSA